MGATSLKEICGAAVSGMVLEGYRSALRSAFLVGTGLAAMSMISAALVLWRSTRKASTGATSEKAWELS